MEKVYRKRGKRYEPIGYNVPDLTDGIWLVQTKPGIQSISNLVYKIGDVKKPVDVVKEAAIHAMGETITRYIAELGNQDSEEYKEAEEMLGAFLRGPVSFSNISPYDLTTLILKRISQEIK